MMKTILYKIPTTLLYSRLVVAVVIIASSFIVLKPELIAVLSIYAVLSDVFDGIIARKLNISNSKMRELDTKIDTVFWFSCLLYLCMKHSDFITGHAVQLLILVMSELFIIVFGQLKFKARISFHTYLAKGWTILILWFFIEIVLTNTGGFIFGIMFWCGLLVQMEIFLIALLLKHCQTDIPGLWYVFKYKLKA